MKKGFVALLIALAVIVLVSPGIVGRLAERSMEENLDWAATENREVVVTSQGFERGWFSSAGQHRIELKDGELRGELLSLTGSMADDDVPVLIIDTRLDHGIVPLASMSRDHGSLMPGLGNAVSTLHLEYADGASVDLPGKIYSNIGLTGNLRSNLILEAGTFEQNANKLYWGDVDIDVTTDPAGGAVGFDGTIESFQVFGEVEAFDLGRIVFSGNKHPTAFGLSTGKFNLAVDSVDMEANDGTQAIGPLKIETRGDLDGDNYEGRVKFQLESTPFGEFGVANITADIRVEDLDAEALGRITDTIKSMPDDSQDDLFALAENDLKILFASGFEMNVDQFDVALPQGPITTELHITVGEGDADPFHWSSVLLGLDASARIRIPAELIDIIAATQPEIHGAIGMGFLRLEGNFYEMEAAFESGLLTVNGAPMPIPLPGGMTQ